MADVTGGTAPTNASPFAVPADIQAVYDHFGASGFYSVSTIAGLPVTGNWAGRILSVTEDESVRKWDGSGWDIIWQPQTTVTLSTFGSFWAATSGYEPFLRIDGKRRQIFGAATRSSGGARAGFITIPVGHRPAANTFVGASISSVGEFAQLHLNTTGSLDLATGYGAAPSPGTFPLCGEWWVA